MSEPTVSAARIAGVRADLDWIAAHVVDLFEVRLKGTSRPWKEQAGTEDSRAAAAALARVERVERDARGLASAPAPSHVDVLDLIVELVCDADHLAETVCQAAGVDRLPPASSAYADPTPYLKAASAWLSQAAYADPWALDLASDVGHRHRDLVATALGELVPGQTLKAACPWCRGVTPSAPTGGAFTLSVRVHLGEAVIACTGLCEPPEADVGAWWNGHPAWLQHEWTWLAERIAHADLGTEAA